MYQQISGQFHNTNNNNNNNDNPIQSSPIRTNVYNKQLLNQTYHTTTSQQNKTIVNGIDLRGRLLKRVRNEKWVRSENDVRSEKWEF